jgi:hypothetical protein
MRGWAAAQPTANGDDHRDASDPGNTITSWTNRLANAG